MATTKVRIDFQIRETSPDGSVTENELRYITFGDEVEPHRVKDFFERCGLASDLMFNGKHLAHVIRFNRDCVNKIGAIKVVRVLTGIGLREAKDIVEQTVGAPLVMVEDGREVDAVLQRFYDAGVPEVRADRCNAAEAIKTGVIPVKGPLL